MVHQLILNKEPYPYEVSHSKRARYLRIKLSPEGVITLVVPTGISLQKAQLFLDSKKTWLEKHLQGLPKRISFEESRPNILALDFIGEQWLLEYRSSDSSCVELQEEEGRTAILTGCVNDKPLVVKALGRWLKAKAKRVLPTRLSELAELHGFHYNRVTIRGQKTRWGSCSSQKNINLNYKLLFLDKALVDYVIVHELCHTIEMNHSKRFWDLVADCDEQYQQHDRLLNEVGKRIPI